MALVEYFRQKLKGIKGYLCLSVSEKYIEQFDSEINTIALQRVKYIAKTLLILEIMILIASFIGKTFFTYHYAYYQAMYVIMILGMIIYLVLFLLMEKGKIRTNRIIFYTFTSFVLLWNIGITLLDQCSNGQVIVYFITVISIGLISLYKPLIILSLYVYTHLIFVILLPYFQKSSSLLFANIVNTSIAVTLSWVIQCLIYKNRVNDFNNRKIIQDKNDELMDLYKKLKQTNEELEQIAQRDGLTGIYNRLMFDKLLKIEWELCLNKSIQLTLILIDIDFFKAFNDNYGHQAGDSCIKEVAKVLFDFCNNSLGFAARYGGEEFAVVINNFDKDKAYSVAEQLRKNVEKLNITHEFSSAAKHITVSIGVYTALPTNNSSMEEFIKYADCSLYKAKSENRNTVVLYKL